MMILRYMCGYTSLDKEVKSDVIPKVGDSVSHKMNMYTVNRVEFSIDDPSSVHIYLSIEQ